MSVSGSQLAFTFDFPATEPEPVCLPGTPTEQPGGDRLTETAAGDVADGWLVNLLADPVPERIQLGPGDLSYELRVSTRARRLTLRVMPGRGLVVTKPKRFPRRDVAAFVENNRVWVESALRDLHERTPPQYRQWPPESLHCALSDKTLAIRFAPSVAGVRPAARLCGNELIVCADREDRTTVASLIAAVLQPLAKPLLLPRLAELAQRHGLSYRRAAIRGQRSVWGSYSSSGTLSLNYKLLFLRPRLVDYVLLHELAHTEFLDHSDAFWSRLCEFEPQTLKLDGELNAAAALVPPWLELARSGLVSKATRVSLG